eukprot:SAG11_NODE_5046_length_1680_cov_1.595825_1_plen_151_part_00
MEPTCDICERTEADLSAMGIGWNGDTGICAACQPEEYAEYQKKNGAGPGGNPAWDTFYMKMTDLRWSNIWKSRGHDPSDVMRIIDAELKEFMEFKGLGFSTNDEKDRTDFGLLIDKIKQELNVYSRLWSPPVNQDILIDAVNKIADEFKK